MTRSCTQTAFVEAPRERGSQRKGEGELGSSYQDPASMFSAVATGSSCVVNTSFFFYGKRYCEARTRPLGERRAVYPRVVSREMNLDDRLAASGCIDRKRPHEPHVHLGNLSLYEGHMPHKEKLPVSPDVALGDDNMGDLDLHHLGHCFLDSDLVGNEGLDRSKDQVELHRCSLRKGRFVVGVRDEVVCNPSGMIAREVQKAFSSPKARGSQSCQ